MTKIKAAALPPGLVKPDPTLPTTSITIEGTEYRMCFDLGALAQAEHELNAPSEGRPNGADVNLLIANPYMSGLKLWNTRILFAASLRRFQPEIAWEDALALLTSPYLLKAMMAVAAAYSLSAPEPEPGNAEEEQNPTEP